MGNTLAVWALVVGCAAMFVLCDSLSANWGKTDSRTSLALFVVLSPVSYFIFALINKTVDLAVAAALVNTMIVVGAVLVGVFYFGEQLSKLQYIGIGLALVSVTLLNVS